MKLSITKPTVPFAAFAAAMHQAFPHWRNNETLKPVVQLMAAGRSYTLATLGAYEMSSEELADAKALMATMGELGDTAQPARVAAPDSFAWMPKAAPQRSVRQQANSLRMGRR